MSRYKAFRLHDIYGILSNSIHIYTCGAAVSAINAEYLNFREGQIKFTSKDYSVFLEHSEMYGKNKCNLFGSLPPTAEEDAGGAGQDSGADAARTERELLNLLELSGGERR